MIPYGRAPNRKEYNYAVQILSNRSDVVTDFLKEMGTDITGEDIVRLIVNDMPSEPSYESNRDE